MRKNLFPPLHDLCTHFHKACFCFTVWKARDSIDCFIDVFLREYARLFETGAVGDDFAGLCLLLAI
jgi:hypothetical protein